MSCSINSFVRENVISMNESASVQEGVDRMVEKAMGSLVLLRDGRVVGMFTEQDLMKRVITPGLDPKTTPLGEVCTRELISVSTNTSCRDAVYRMRVHNCRRLLVYRGDHFIGLLKLHDMAHALADHSGRANQAINVVGGMTLLLALGVIAMLLLQLPEMISLAQQTNGR